MNKEADYVKYWQEDGAVKRKSAPLSRPRYSKYIELVSKLSKCYPSEGYRLELGCGAGHLATRVPNYIGLSISLNELMRIKQRDNSVILICANAETLPIRESAVAMIFEYAFLEHVAHPEEVLSECIRIIQPKGIIIHDTAWNVRSWAANPTTYKKWQECNVKEKLLKLTIPIRNSLIFRFSYTFPMRLLRELAHFTRHHISLDYTKLTPNTDLRLGADENACSSIDPHALIMFYESRKFETMDFLRRLFFRTGPVTIQDIGERQ